MVTCTISVYGAYRAKNLEDFKTWLLVQFLCTELTVQKNWNHAYRIQNLATELTVQTF